MIKSLSISIEDGKIWHWDVNIDFINNKGKYRFLNEANLNRKLVEKDFSKERIENFYTKLDALEILYWDDVYNQLNENRFSWRIELVYKDGIRKVSNGINKTPENWEDFCLLLENFLNVEGLYRKET